MAAGRPMNVRLTAYTPQWAVAFECARVALIDALPLHLVFVEHFGSSAVPGLPAKPVIDILDSMTAPALTNRKCRGLHYRRTRTRERCRAAYDGRRVL